MIPASSIFRLVALAWVVIFATAFALSPIQLETKALLNTGWWNGSFWATNYSSDHCKWIGITCNSAGSIIGLHLSSYDVDLNAQAQLSQLNFSCFPNLESLESRPIIMVLLEAYHQILVLFQNSNCWTCP